MRKIKVYLRLVLVVAVLFVIGAVVVKNRSNQVTFWFFHTYEKVNVVWLLACTAIASILSFWILSTVFSLYREMKKLAIEEEIQKRELEQKKKEDLLSEQEKRIDEKRSRFLREDGDR